MRRISLAVSLLLVFAGCSAPGAAPPEPIVAPDVTLEPGETKQLTVEVRNVTAVRASEVASPISIRHSNATMEPSNDITLESDPPIWMWETRQESVTLTLPVSARANATAGEYEYRVGATGNVSDESGTMDAGTVTVVSDS